MAFSQYGDDLDAGDWIPQADFDANQGDTGGWTASQSYLVTRGSIDEPAFQSEFRYGRLATELDPNLDSYWKFLTLNSIPRVSHERGGLSRIVVMFGGFSPTLTGDGSGDNVILPQYSLRGELAEASIMEHPEVRELAVEEQAILRAYMDGTEYGYNGTNFTFTTVLGGAPSIQTLTTTSGAKKDAPAADGTPVGTLATTYAKKICGGLRSYRFPTFVWTKRWQDEIGLSASVLNDLGHISSPDGGPPTPSGTRDWLMTSAFQEKVGNLYNNHIDWTLSDRGGWDSTLYS